MNCDDDIFLVDTYYLHLADDPNFLKEHANDLHDSYHKASVKFVSPKIATRQSLAEIAFRIKTCPLRLQICLSTWKIIIGSSFPSSDPCLVFLHKIICKPVLSFCQVGPQFR